MHIDEFRIVTFSTSKDYIINLQNLELFIQLHYVAIKTYSDIFMICIQMSALTKCDENKNF